VGQPVVHFEILGKDGQRLHDFYSSLFGWEIDASNPMGYGMVAREGNTTDDGTGIGGGISGAMQGNEGYEGHVTVYVQVPDVEQALEKAEALGGKRMMGPAQPPGGPTIGLFTDPEGHLIGVLQ
jgi:predicted enzyme related to lactoylglutathione lyase